MQFKKSIILMLILLTVATSALTACDPKNPTDQVENYINLTPPAFSQYEMILHLMTVGTTNRTELVSNLFGVTYAEAGSGGAGSVSFETFRNNLTGQSGVMQEMVLGDWRQGTISFITSSDPNGCLVQGQIKFTVKSVSAWQWLFLDFSRTVNRSSIYFEFLPDEPCGTPRLQNVYYFEEWGTTDKDILAMGAFAVWHEASYLFPDYANWGFWEKRESPYSQATKALEYADDLLKETPPSFKVVDRDSVREVIGRQSGLDLQVDGQDWGTIRFEYKNNFGVMPNARAIGSGSLSKITWTLDGQDFYLIVLTPAFTPEQTSLFVFADSAEGVAYIEQKTKAHEWPQLYDEINAGNIPGVSYAIYAAGHIGNITQSVSTTNSDGVTSSKTIDIGNGGGLYYSTIGEPTAEDINQSYALLSLMGLGGIKATGFYYAYEQGSGNGLIYYLSALRLLVNENALFAYGYDIGLLDRPGFPEWETFVQ